MEELRENLLPSAQGDLGNQIHESSFRSTPSYTQFPNFIYGISDVTRCPSCSQENIPNKIYQPNSVTWGLCGGICLVGCWFGLCLLPLCDSNFQEATIYCSLCNKTISRKV